MEQARAKRVGVQSDAKGGAEAGAKRAAGQRAEAEKNRKEGKGGDAGPGRLLCWAEKGRKAYFQIKILFHF